MAGLWGSWNTQDPASALHAASALAPFAARGFKPSLVHENLSNRRFLWPWKPTCQNPTELNIITYHSLKGSHQRGRSKKYTYCEFIFSVDEGDICFFRNDASAISRWTFLTDRSDGMWPLVGDM